MDDPESQPQSASSAPAEAAETRPLGPLQTPASAPPSAPAPDYPEDVRIVEDGERRIVLVGTAHISQESVDLVRHVIGQERPDVVCVELDPRRYEALSQRKRWEALDLREVIQNRQLATLLLNFFLASYQKRLGGKLGVMPGSELLEATRTAEAEGVPFELCDRDVRVTLRRAWAALSLWKKASLISAVMASAFETPELSEEDLRKLRQKDVLSELMEQLGQALPELKRALIDERDQYLAAKIGATEGNTVVAVVGAGHVAGMVEVLKNRQPVDLQALDTIPPVSGLWRTLGWSVAAVILGSLAYIGMTRGPQAAGDSALYWFLANAIPCAVGGIVALAHPLTILAGFMAAPFTSLTPVIGAGYVTAAVQVYLAPPRVHEFQSVGEDIAEARTWWRSRLLRVFLVFLLTSLGSFVGTWVGGVEVVSNLFPS
ncbi:MAG: TraB/GumN family protein [Myxococcales bacterium]|nr:TraB/GumN family protein [Myxococcales bacterium]